jgi:hypothetical protein
VATNEQDKSHLIQDAHARRLRKYRVRWVKAGGMGLADNGNSFNGLSILVTGGLDRSDKHSFVTFLRNTSPRV